MKPKIEHVAKHDILYLEFSDEPVVRTFERHPWAIVELDAADVPVSLEILGASKVQAYQVAELLREIADLIPHRMAVPA